MTLLFTAEAGITAEDKPFRQEVLEILRDEGKIDDKPCEDFRAKEEAEHDASPIEF